MTGELARRLAETLWEVGGVKFGSFRLKLHDKSPEAPLSPIYIDLRVLRSFPEGMDVAVEVYHQLIKPLRFDLYADVPTASTPIVAVLSHTTRVPMVSPRIDQKSHGTQDRIDGTYQHGQVALVIDDLITHAESKLQAIGVLEHGGLIVRDVAVLLDREQGGSAELARRGYGFRSALRLTELLEIFRDTGRISDMQHAETLRYLNKHASA